jgi:flagellar FliJ protein
MAKKGFGLEKVLNYRNEVEKVRKVEFATARQEFEGASEELKHEENKVMLLQDEYLDRQQAGITAMELQLYADFFVRKSVDIQLKRIEVNSLNSEMVQKQDVLAQAAMEKKVLETLKEKKVLAYKREILDKERAFLEEIALRKKVYR